MAHTRAANDFHSIRARIEESRRERELPPNGAEPDARSVWRSLCRANGDPIIISGGRLGKELANCPESGAAGRS
jgi:hypothetical protein